MLFLNSTGLVSKPQSARKEAEAETQATQHIMFNNQDWWQQVSEHQDTITSSFNTACTYDNHALEWWWIYTGGDIILVHQLSSTSYVQPRLSLSMVWSCSTEPSEMVLGQRVSTRLGRLNANCFIYHFYEHRSHAAGHHPTTELFKYDALYEHISGLLRHASLQYNHTAISASTTTSPVHSIIVITSITSWCRESCEFQSASMVCECVNYALRCMNWNDFVTKPDQHSKVFQLLVFHYKSYKLYLATLSPHLYRYFMVFNLLTFHYKSYKLHLSAYLQVPKIIESILNF